ncbi:hypothetical protein EDD18DRAFT_1178909 [Armillaria luteobubalina]|uniref:Uncharacterized protein n=1 Tax=Armillaria luteobubalina TaxID=153913 RepID=A0AA39UUN1_9AGAR|nr:hypothetical protein EDD18DRAFT_1178909 [Armillaria luteobubalina]
MLTVVICTSCVKDQTTFRAPSHHYRYPLCIGRQLLNSCDSADFIIEFEVLLEDKPVLLPQIEEPRKAVLHSAHEAADDQIRKRMRDLAPSCPFDILHGVSAFGTRLSFYRYDVETRIIPSRVIPDPEREADIAPLSRWDCDILEDEGSHRFQDAIAAIKAKCEQLQGRI